MPDDVNIEVLPPISDHMLVLCHFKVQFEQVSHIERLVFDYHRVNWKAMMVYLSGIEWTRISTLSANDAAIFLLIIYIIELSILFHLVRLVTLHLLIFGSISDVEQ